MTCQPCACCETERAAHPQCSQCELLEPQVCYNDVAQLTCKKDSVAQLAREERRRRKKRGRKQLQQQKQAQEQRATSRRKVTMTTSASS